MVYICIGSIWELFTRIYILSSKLFEMK